MWDDIQSLFTQHQQDVTELLKEVTDLQAKKCDKKEFLQQIQKMQGLVAQTETGVSETRLVNMNAEFVEKIADLRSDMVKRFSDMHT